MYCEKCGHEIKEDDKFCSYCGVENKSFKGYSYFNEKVEQENTSNSVNKDSGNMGFGVVGFFVPICGLILYLCWKKEKPKTAKYAGIGALLSVGISFVLCLFIIICVVASGLA